MKKIKTIDDVLEPYDPTLFDSYDHGLIEVKIAYHNPNPIDEEKSSTRFVSLNKGIITVRFNLETIDNYKDAIRNYFQDFCGNRGSLYDNIAVDGLQIKPIKWSDINSSYYDDYSKEE